ncbi:MAG: alpha/beta fold hydrolase [Pseudomonadota bacterium]
MDRTHRAHRIAFALLRVAVALVATSGAASATTLELTACTLSGGTGIASVEARCGWFERPENPAEPEGRTIQLRVAVIDSLSPNPLPDAFTIINGGPGGSSLDLYADMAATFGAIRRDRVIVILDQRGTGASNPLDCEALEGIELEYSEALVREATAACLAGLSGDPRFYTTSVAVQDLEALRMALEYSALNVYGVSYGTRVAQHYARRHTDAVRTLIIDGVAPPEVPLGPNAALNAQRTLDRLFDRCAEDARCNERFPDLENKLATLDQRLSNEGPAVEIAHPITGERTELELRRDHLLVTLRLLSYVPETARLIPLIIDEAVAENYVPLATNALRIERQLVGALRFGMHNAVICTEDIPFLGPLDRDALEATYIGSEQAESLITICENWPRGLMDADLREPLTVAVPTLVLSGEEDPITPPDYGTMAEAALPVSLHLVGRGQGHGVVGRGCVPRLLTEFVDSADLDTLDTACMDRLSHAPFFLNLMGTVPAQATQGVSP